MKMIVDPDSIPLQLPAHPEPALAIKKTLVISLLFYLFYFLIIDLFYYTEFFFFLPSIINRPNVRESMSITGGNFHERFK